MVVEKTLTTPAFENNGVTFETTQANDNYTVPEELVLNPADTDTVYTIGTQCEFTLDGETFVSPWAFTQYTFIAAPQLNTVTVLTVGGGGGGRGNGQVSVMVEVVEPVVSSSNNMQALMVISLLSLSVMVVVKVVTQV